jgi:hypothetical protein
MKRFRFILSNTIFFGFGILVASAQERENLDYIAMNPVKEGYVAYPQFYPYTGFLN